MAVSFQLLRSSTASKRPTAANLAAGELGLNFNDDTSGLFYENASGNIMKVGPAEVGATAPNASPASGGSSGNSKGELWYDSGNSILKVYDGSSFVASANVTTITGVTAGTVSASKAVVVDSNKDITGFRNVTATGDVTIPEGDLILGSTAVTSTAAELNLVDGITAGTVSASKAVIVDADKDVTGFRNITLTGELDAVTLDISGNADIDGVLNADAVDIDGNTNMAGNLTFSGGATNMVLTDNTAGALDIKEGATSYFKFDTTDGSELITAAKAVALSSTLSVAGDVTFSTAQDISVIDNSGLALRIMESTNEYFRIVTTDGSESVTIKKTLETDGDLQIDGGVTMPAATDIGIVDNSGLALRVMEGTNEYVRFTTTDGSELVDFTKSVKLDGGVDIAGPMTITGDIDCTLDSGTSNALDFVISGGNRMMRFNTNTETVLLEQNFEVDGTATFDGAMDIDSTMDISGGDVTFSANTDIHIPDNSGQALDIAEAGNTYVRFITTDDSEKIEISKDVDINADLYVTGGDIYFDNAANSQLHLQASQQYALEIRDPNTPYITIDTRTAAASYGTTFNQPLSCSQVATFNNNLTFDSVTLTAIQTSSETFADNDTSLMTSAAIEDRINSVSGVTQSEGTFTATFNGSTGEPGTKVTTTGYYVKVGKMVTVTVDTGAVSWTGYTGNFSVTGLPETAKSGYDFVGSFVSSGGVFESANNDGLVCHIAGGGTTLDLRAQDGDNASVTWSQQGTDTINFTITYFTA